MKVLLLGLVLASTLPSFAIAQTAHSGGGALAYERSFASDPIIKPHNTLRSREYQPNSVTNNTFQYATPSTVTMSHRPIVRSLSSYNYAKRYEKPQNAPFTKTKPQNITQTILINREVLASDCPKGTEEQSDGRCLKIRKIVETRKPVILISPCPKGTSAKEDGSCVKRQKVIVKKTPVIVKAECPKGTKDIGDGKMEPVWSTLKRLLNLNPLLSKRPAQKGQKIMATAPVWSLQKKS